MRDWLKNLGEVEIIVAIIVGLIGIVSAAYALETHWNQQEDVEDAMFLAMTNKETYLEEKMTDICASYNRLYPCTTNGMSDFDAARYEKYKKWLEQLQESIGKKVTKG
jgi:hypothetical protein